MQFFVLPPYPLTTRTSVYWAHFDIFAAVVVDDHTIRVAGKCTGTEFTNIYIQDQS